MKRSIRNCFGTGIVSCLLLMTAALPAWARSAHTVTLKRDVVVHGTTLHSGKYSVEWETHSPEATVQFVQRHKVMVSTEGRLEQRDKIYDSDAAVYDVAPDGSVSLVELRFANSNKVLVFNQ